MGNFKVWENTFTTCSATSLSSHEHLLNYESMNSGGWLDNVMATTLNILISLGHTNCVEPTSIYIVRKWCGPYQFSPHIKSLFKISTNYTNYLFRKLMWVNILFLCCCCCWNIGGAWPHDWFIRQVKRRVPTKLLYYFWCNMTVLFHSKCWSQVSRKIDMKIQDVGTDIVSTRIDYKVAQVDYFQAAKFSTRTNRTI